MTYDFILSSLRSSYNWLFGIFFPRFFAWCQNNELVSTALIISIVIPSLFFIINFFLEASSDSDLYTSKVLNNKRIRAQQDVLKEQRKMIYYNRNKYDKK